MNIVPEVWLSVPGYEDCYEASNTGLIRSVDRVIAYKQGVNHFHRGVMLKQRIAHNGYLRVSLGKHGKLKGFFAHRIIALCFLGAIPQGHEVNHKNGVKTDNRAENLEYVTHSENRKHAFRIGLQKKQVGEDHHGSKLTEQAVREIKARLKNERVKDLALIYGVSITTVSDIKHNRTWTHV